jgi:hypothetical protein
LIFQNILKIKTNILEVLGDEIGTYTLVGGITVPAIAVSTGNYPPQGTQVEGLEVIIVPQTDTEINQLIRGGRWEVTSIVVLKQWGEGDVVTAMEKIVPLLGNQVTIGARILPDNTLGNIETIRISFKWEYLQRIGEDR